MIHFFELGFDLALFDDEEIMPIMWYFDFIQTSYLNTLEKYTKYLQIENKMLGAGGKKGKKEVLRERDIEKFAKKMTPQMHWRIGYRETVQATYKVLHVNNLSFILFYLCFHSLSFNFFFFFSFSFLFFSFLFFFFSFFSISGY